MVNEYIVDYYINAWYYKTRGPCKGIGQSQRGEEMSASNISQTPGNTVPQDGAFRSFPGTHRLVGCRFVAEESGVKFEGVIDGVDRTSNGAVFYNDDGLVAFELKFCQSFWWMEDITLIAKNEVGQYQIHDVRP